MLLSVHDMLSKGNRVIFDPQGSYVENITTGDWTPIEQKSGIFIMRLWVKRNPQNNAQSRNPPATPQIELSILPRAVPYQRALPQIPEGAIIKTADLQNFYRLVSQLYVRPTTRRGPRPPGEATSAAAHDINVHNLDGAVEEARVDAPERIARLPRANYRRERGTRHVDTSLSDLGPGHA